MPPENRKLDLNYEHIQGQTAAPVISCRYIYSFRDRKSLEQLFGLEYESCCWGLRMVSRRYLSTRDGNRDSSFGIQLVLKGMGSVGTAADRSLERGILGYSSEPD